MKIFVVGESQPWSWETFCVEIFRRLGCEVSHWDNRKPSRLFGNRSWWTFNRVERLAYDSFASKNFYDACKEFRPDVIFMPKAENIHSYAVRKALEETKSRLVVWYPDHPMKADQTSMNILRNLKRCDFFYVWGKFLIEALQSAGCKHAEYLPFGFYPEYHNPHTLIREEDFKTYGSDICFVGTWQPDREEILEKLIGFKLAIWGPHWKEKLSSDSPLRKHLRGGGLYGLDMVKAFKCAKVVFNLVQPHNGSAHNQRTIDITGIGGGVQVVRRTVEQATELFKEGEHLFCYENDQEMLSTLSDLLMDNKLLASVSERAKQQTHQHHLLRDRLKYILSRL